jgi:tellurite resistance protein
MPKSEPYLIGKVAQTLSQPPPDAEAGIKGSILVAAAASYGSQTPEDHTQPTGFDVDAARLFEGIVESAYLVATADGDFDDAVESVVISACGGRVAERQITALLADLAEQLSEDGADKRIQMVARGITREEHAREVLRVAALLSHVSGGVSDVERSVLDRLAEALSLGREATTHALAEAKVALSK